MKALLHSVNILLLCALCVVLCVGVLASPVFAQPSYTINYQGKLTTPASVAVTDGTYDMVFKLYTTPTGGSAIWTETRTGGNVVTVDSGLFSVMLGSVTSLTSVNFNQTLYLGVTIEADAEMTPRKILGTVPSAFEAKQLGGVASTSFLRSDTADSASGLLTFTGGLISTASSSIGRLSFTNATGTSLYLGGDRITDFSGTNLEVTGNSLGLSTSYLGQTSITTLGTITTGTWTGSAISSTYLDSSILTASEVSDSAELAALLSDETGFSSGALAVFSISPTITGTADFVAGDFSSTLTMSGSAANIALGLNYLSGDGGDEGVYVGSTGLVGIGTTTPTAALHIRKTGSAANIVLDTTTGRNGIDFRSSYSQRAYVGLDFVSSEFNLWLEGDTTTGIIFATNGTGEKARFTLAGNLGIGTTTPASKLQVLSTTEQLRLAYSQTQYWSDTIASDGGRTMAGFGTDADLNLAFTGATDGDFSINTDDLFVDTSTGNVGIGDTTPDYLFDVGGSAGFDGLLTMTGSAANIALGSNFISNAGADEGISVGASGNVTISGTLGVTSGLTIDATTETNIEAAIDTLGSLTSASSLATVGTITSGTWQGTAIDITRGGLGAAFTDPNADQLMFWDDSLGAITGIGTLTGAAISGTTLTVNDVTCTDCLTSTEIADEYLFNTGDTISGNLTLSGSTANILLGSNYLSGDGGDEGIFVDSTGNIGIGTTTPNTALSISVGNTSTGPISITTNSSGSTVGIDFNHSTARYGFVGIRSSLSVAPTPTISRSFYLWADTFGSPMIFGTNNTERMRLSGTGDLGIGTTTPASKLQVLSTTEQLRLAYNQTQYWSDTIASDGGRTMAGFGTDADLNLAFTGATDGDFSVNTDDLFVDTSTGNVGVGDTTPDYLFDVGGAAGFDGLLTMTGSAANIALGSNYLSGDGGDEGIYVGSTGLVGIGTTTPTAALHVRKTGSAANIVLDTTTGRNGIDFRTAYQQRAYVGLDFISSEVGLWLETIVGGPIIFATGGTGEKARFSATGSLGIGTTTPASKLQVLSTTEQLRLAYSQTQYWSDTIASDGGRTMAGFGTDADLNLAFGGATDGDFSVNTDDIFVDTSTGNVGIGDTTPDYLFDVGGSAGFDGLLTMTGTAANIALGSNFISNAGADEGISVGASGNVTISGTLGVTSGLTIDATTETNIEAAIDTLGSLTSASSLATVGTITSGTWQGGVISSTYLDTALLLASELDTCAEFAALGSIETGTCGSLVLSVSPAITGTLDVEASDFSGLLTMSGSAANIALGSNYLSGDGGDEGIFVDSSGNIGIGTTTPSAKLFVRVTGSSVPTLVGNEVAVFQNNQSGSHSSAIALLSGSTASSSIYFGNIGSIREGSIVYSPASDSFSFQTGGISDRLVIVGGNVGIGDTSPSADLNIGTGNVSTVDGANDLFVTDDLEVDGDGIFGGILTTTGGLTIDATTETNIEAAIDTLANLTSASSLATVGTITSGTWGGSFSNNVVTPNSVFTTSQTDEYCLTYEATGTTWEWQVCAGASGANTALSNLASVAINTSLLPGSDDTIDLGSDTLRFRDLYLGGETLHLGTSLTDEGVVSYTTSSNLLNFSTDSTSNGDIAFFGDDLYLDKSSANIGVGTTTPTAKLDVQGSAEFGTENVALITSAGKIAGLSSTYFGTDTSANLATILTDETGSAGGGVAVFSISPTLTTPNLGTPSAIVLTSGTGLPISTGLTGAGTGVLTALAVNIGTAGSFVVNGGALGTPSSGTVTNLTGTASININGTVGATTPAAGTFTSNTANSFVPNLSTIPSNGMYLPAANTLGWGINSAAEMQLTSTALSPAADGGSSLGTTALGWQNLFANTGFVLNIENSNWVATHTSGVLTVGTGDLQITTAGTNAASVVTVGGIQTLTNKTLTSPTFNAATLNGTLTFDATAENTVDALIFDTDAENITGVWEVADDVDFVFGTDADWAIQYDEGVDNQLLFITAATAAIATTDPMVEFLVGTTPTANQQVFGVAKGTQVANTALFTIDAEGDALITGTLGTTGGLTIDATTETNIEAAIDTLGSLTSASTLATVGTIGTGVWQGTDVGVAYGGTGLSTFGGTNHILYTTAADALSSEAAFTYTAGTDTLAAVNLSLTTGLTFTGVGALNGVDSVDATTESTIEAAIDTLGSLTSASTLATVGTITSGTWGGAFSNNVVTPNSVFTTSQTDEYCLTYETTGTTWEWQSCSGAVTTTEITDDTITFADINMTAAIASDPAFAANDTFFGSTGIIFEGGTADAFEGLLTSSVATADKTWTLPNVTGTIITTGDTGSVTNAMLAGSIAASKLTGTDIVTVGTITSGTWQGTAIDITRGGLGDAFTDPNADQLMFWDDSAARITGISTITGGSISGTTLTIAVGASEITDDTITFADINMTAAIASDPAFAANDTFFGSTGIIFEGGTADAFEGLLTSSVATADKTWTLPNVTGTIITTGDTGSVTNAMLAGSIAASKLTGTDIATLGTITAGTWTAGVISSTYLDTATLLASELDTCAEFAALGAIETGTCGSLVLSVSPTFTTNITVANDTAGSALTIGRQDNTSEGGQISFVGAASYDGWTQDSYLHTMRFYTNSANTNSLDISNIGAGISNFSVEGTLAAAGGTLSSNLTLSGSAANILLGSNYLSGDGADEGISVDASGNVLIPGETLSVCSGGACASTANGDGTITAERAITSEESSLTAGAGIALNWDNGNQQYLSLTTNSTIGSFTNNTTGQTLRLVVCQDATGGRTFTFSPTIKWSGATTPTQTSTLNKCDVYSFIQTTAGTLGSFNQNF